MKNKLFRYLSWGAGGLLLLLIALLLKTLYDTGSFKNIIAHGPALTRIRGIAGAEDITIDQETGWAFISSEDRRANGFPLEANKTLKQGAIFGLDLESDSPRPVNLTQQVKFPLHPHGISLWRGNGKVLLFVVNHRPAAEETIEIFEWKDAQLIHRESIRDAALMHSPNDVVAVGERQFYVSNDHYYRYDDWRRTLEEYLQWKMSYVLYYDGKQFRKAAEGFAYANGINVSADGKTVYLAQPVGQCVGVLDRDVASGDLKLREQVYLGTGVDNIEISPKGELWIGAHPQLLAFVAHKRNERNLSPSQILRLRWEAGKPRWEDVLVSTGSDGLNASTVAAVYRGQMLIGTVFADGVWIGQVKE